MSKKTATNEMLEKQKTYILELTNGDIRKVTVPESWRLTFGPTIPFTGGKQYQTPTSTNIALRFYEGAGKDNLRAVFTDVKSFRDEGISIMERRTETHHKVVQQGDGAGAHNVAVEARVTQWVNPDNELQAEPASPPNKYFGLLNGIK